MEVLGPLGFSLGALGFLVTVRNAIEKILIDVDQWKKWSERLVPLMTEVQFILYQLTQWQNFWYIDCDRSETAILVKTYWGQEGSTVIVDLLLGIRTGAEAVEKEFRKLYGRAYHELRAKWKEALESKQELSFDRAARDLQLRLVEFKQNAGLWRRARAVLYQNQIFKKNLESLQRDFQRLDVWSQKQFVQTNRGNDYHQWEEKVHEIVAGTNLPRISSRFAERGKTLHLHLEHLARETNFQFGLHLDHGTSPEDRQQLLIACALDNVIQTYFHLRPKVGGSEIYHCLSLRTEIGSESPGDTDGMVVDQSSRKSTISGRLENGMEVEYGILEGYKDSIVETSRVQCNARNARNLRQKLASSGSAGLSEKEQVRLRYELVEFAFFFLKTAWLSNICSCSLHRFAAAPRQDGRFTIDVGGIHHFTSLGAPAMDLETWCMMPSLHKQT